MSEPIRFLELNRHADDFIRMVSVLERTNEKLSRTLHLKNGEWEGKTSIAFEEEVQKLRKRIYELKKECIRIHNKLRLEADEVAEREVENS